VLTTKLIQVEYRLAAGVQHLLVLRMYCIV
jgi:hypothetical protein